MSDLPARTHSRAGHIGGPYHRPECYAVRSGSWPCTCSYLDRIDALTEALEPPSIAIEEWCDDMLAQTNVSLMEWMVAKYVRGCLDAAAAAVGEDDDDD